MYIIRVARVRVGESRRCVYSGPQSKLALKPYPSELSVCRFPPWNVENLPRRLPLHLPLPVRGSGPHPRSVPAGGAFFHLCLDFPCCKAVHRILWFVGRGARDGALGPFHGKQALVVPIREDEPQVVLGRQANQAVAGVLSRLGLNPSPWVR